MVENGKSIKSDGNLVIDTMALSQLLMRICKKQQSMIVNLETRLTIVETNAEGVK